MFKQSSSLFKAFDIIHSSLVYIFVICAVHVLFVTSTLKDAYPVITLLFIGIKIYIESGTYGSIIDIASSKIASPSVKNFRQNAKKYWKIYTLLLFIKLITIHGINHICGHFSFRGSFPPVYMDLFILYLISSFIFKDKFIRPLNLRPRRMFLTKTETCQTIFLYIINVMIPLLINPLQTHTNFLTNEPIAIFTYSHLLLFSFLSQIFLKNYPEIENSLENKGKELYLICPAMCGLFTGLIYGWLKLHPAFFIILKALTPKEYAIKKFSMLPWKKRFYKKNKLVAITCYTSNCHEAYNIAKGFKDAGSTVIMGGPHVTFFPDEALQFCHSVVIGEAESVWAPLIKEYESGQLQKKYFGEALDQVPPEIQEELLSSDPQIVKDYIETTRGCKFHCDFCTISSLSNGKLRKKPIEEVIAILKKLLRSKYKFILLMDNNIYSDPQYAKELFKAIKPLKIKWGSQCSIDIGKDPEALRLAKESGCIHLLIGYEIFDDSQETTRGGKLAYSPRYKELTKAIKKAGIPIKAHFIFGFESDRLSHFFHLWFFCTMLNLPFAAFTILTPLPGTKLHANLLKEDRILNYNWRNYDLQHLVFEHENLPFHQTAISFFFFRYIAYFTTNMYGYTILALIIIDAVFFQLEHFLF